MAMYKVVFVSLGPGDPELITVKGLKALHAADVIFAPATKSRTGEELSRSESVILSLGIDAAKVERFHVPMSRDRAATLEAYEQLARKASLIAAQGGRVAITAEGDAGFYSSAQYIEEMLWKRNVETERVSGVPAFVDCARLSQTHIVNQDSSFEVIARVESAEALMAKMAEDKTIVLMKVSQWEEAIKEAVRSSEMHDFYYTESCGVEGKEFHTSNVEEIMERKFPYFAILMIKRRG